MRWRDLCMLLFAVGIISSACKSREMSHWARYDIGGMYHVDIERVGDFDTSVKFDIKEGDEGKRELVEIVSDGNNLRIEDGKLTLNEKDKGLVKPKDQIRLEKTGKLFVNGTER